MFKKIWSDELGAVVSADVILVAVTLVIGLVVGLKSVRDAVLTELADVAQAVANHDQSYSYSGVTGHGTATSGAFFVDTVDFCDDSTTVVDGAGFGIPGSRCVNVGDSVNGNGAFNPVDAGGDPTNEGRDNPL